MKDFKSAFEQAINGFKQNPKKEAAAIGGQFMQNLTNEFNQFKQQFQPRAVYQPPTDQQTINNLRSNAIDHTAYTPQAQAIMQQTPIVLVGQPFTENNPDSVINQQNKYGGMTYGYQQPLNVNRNFIDPSQYGDAGIQTVRHEGLHSMDQNTQLDPRYLYSYNSGQPIANAVPLNYSQAPALANSAGFSEMLRRINPKLWATYNQGLNNHPELYNIDQHTQDVENYAAYGQQGAQALLGNPELAARYRNIYIPMSKYIKP